MRFYALGPGGCEKGGKSVLSGCISHLSVSGVSAEGLNHGAQGCHSQLKLAVEHLEEVAPIEQARTQEWDTTFEIRVT